MLRFEAESAKVSGDIQIIEAAGASGGRAISLPREWNPLMRVAASELPPGENLTVWARHKGATLQLKALAGEKQTELNWIYDAPEAWKWSKFGTYARAQFADGLLIIRGDKSPTLDCIAVSSDPNDDPDQSVAPSAPNQMKTEKLAGKSVPGGEKPGEMAAFDAPPGAMVEAETVKAGGAREVEDAKASGGRAVSVDGDYQPLIITAPPQGDGFEVWIRHRGGPLQLKAGEKGLNWVWDAPAEFKWSSFGKYSRAELGESVVLIRGDKNGPAPTVDAIAWASNAVAALPTNVPDAKAPPLTIRASVDWNRKVGQITPQHWGVNDYEVQDPKNAADPEYQAFLTSLKPALIRIHRGGLSDSWSNAQTRDWDVPKIKAALDAATGYSGAKIMLNLEWWPAWFHNGDTLPPEKEDEYARFCGRLARLMRTEIGHKITYYEITNEREDKYEKEGRLGDLWRLWNKIAAEVKKADPSAKVGGPALTWAKAEWVQGWLKSCGPNADFISWHNYASGDIRDSNRKLFDTIDSNIVPLAKSAVEATKRLAPGRKLETFLSEYNIKWVWEPLEVRHGNNIGAVFQASAVNQLARTGLDGIALWHVKGDAYGIVSGENTVRTTGHFYRWGTRFLSGDIAFSQCADEKNLELLPVNGLGNSRSLLLINKADRRVTVPGGSRLLPGAAAQRVDASGFIAKVPLEGADLLLPGYSVTLLTKSAK